MNTSLAQSKRNESNPNSPESSAGERETVLQELERILGSRHFKNSDRSKQFLRFVISSKLDGRTERLKERSIGIELFHRPPGYATGEDPVVRVQAGEVRRRLDQYYQEQQKPLKLRIELPVGSYSPVFLWDPEPVVENAHPLIALSQLDSPPRWRPISKIFVALAVLILTAFALKAFFYLRNDGAARATKIDQFWGPALASQQPVLICIANATDHSAEEKIVQMLNGRTGNLQGKLQEASGATALASGENVTSEGLPISPEIVPASDASVAFKLSGLFGRLNKPSQLRIGSAATYEDLRSFPAVIIGGFNSKWTMQLISNLHFAFIRDGDKYMIREEVPGGRVWIPRLGPTGETLEDFAIVARLVDSKTGQFTVTVAGIGPRGTQAAGEFVNSTRYLEEGLAGAPADWQNRNLEVLLQTNVTDSMAGPPHVIATYAW